MKKIRNEKLSFEKLTVTILSSKNMIMIKGGETDHPDDPDTITGQNQGGNQGGNDNSSGAC